MKPSTFILLIALTASVVQGGVLKSWEDKVRDLEKKFENWIQGKANALVARVKDGEKTLVQETDAFIQDGQTKIKAAVASGIQDITLLKNDVSFGCYENATKALISAEEGALLDFITCKNMSKAYQDIVVISQKTAVVVADVLKDAGVIIEGIFQCESSVGFAQWRCAIEYAAEEIKQIISQWPDAKDFIVTLGVLGKDLNAQVEACLDSPQHKRIEVLVKEALGQFSTCSKASAQNPQMNNEVY